MRPRALAILTVALLALVGLAPGTASAFAPIAPLTAVANDDGSQSLHWQLEGTSDSINILPHLRCGPDPTATGAFAGSPIPCIWLVDHKAPLVAAPAGCPETGQDYASWRCDMRLYRDITVDAAQAGESSLIMFNTKPAGGSGICSWIPLALRLGSGKGAVQAADGCPERIVCAKGYGGKIVADKLDVVIGCPSTSVSNISGPVTDGDPAGGGSGSDGTTTDPTTGKPSRLDLAKCTGASSGKKGNSPLYSVLVKPKGSRGMTVYVSMRRAVPVTVEVRMRTKSGSRVVRWTPRCAFKGTNVFRFPNATGGARSKRRYKVIVRSTNSTYPLISSYETLPRR